MQTESREKITTHMCFGGLILKLKENNNNENEHRERNERTSGFLCTGISFIKRRKCEKHFQSNTFARC